MSDIDNNIRTELHQFNSEDLLCRIREKYSTPSFFEMIDKTRSETAHSAFLRWMLSGQGVSESTADTPIYLFLNLLAKRSLEQESSGIPLMNHELRDSILSRKIRVSIDDKEAVTEKQISELAELALDSCYKDNDIRRQYLSEIIDSVADRVDVFIHCDVEKCGSIKKLLLIIENKVDSSEGDAKAEAKAKTGAKKKKEKNMPEQYKVKKQTERYYDATFHENNSDTALVYVFLTPKLTNDELQDISKNRTELKEKWKCSQSDHFININYQDVLNNVIDKLLILNEGSITSRTRMFITEYKNEITFPRINNPKKHINIAHPSIEGIETLWKKYRYLLHCIAYSCISNKSFVRVECNALIPKKISYYCTDLVKQKDKYKYTIKIDQLPDNEKELFERKQEVLYQTREINKFKEIMDNKGFSCSDFNKDLLLPETISLLNDYADENLDILVTLISDIMYSSKEFDKEAESLRRILLANTRDTTRYQVYYDNQKLTEKPVSKSEVVFLIFKEWQKIKKYTTDNILAAMREDFPVDINPYYRNGKYFKYLFYPYDKDGNYFFDGEELNAKVDGNWDFYRDDKHQYGGITNLKMWRKDAFEGLLKHLKSENSDRDFYNKLRITDTDDKEIETE